MKEINAVLGENTKKFRNAKHMTREQLAEKIDVSPRFLADLESGKTGVSLSTLKLMCIALDVPADSLLGLSSAPLDEKQRSLQNKILSLNEKYYPALFSMLEELSKL